MSPKECGQIIFSSLSQRSNKTHQKSLKAAKCTDTNVNKDNHWSIMYISACWDRDLIDKMTPNEADSSPCVEVNGKRVNPYS